MRDVVHACESRWRITVGERLPSHASVVYECRDTSGAARILKIVRAAEPLRREIAVLRAWDGQGAPRLIADDPALGALLLERVTPGAHLPPGDDERDTRSVADLLRRLQSVDPPSALPTQAAAYDEWRERVRMNGEPNTAGMRLLEVARAAFTRLDASTKRRVLLHGDFIDKNLLLGASGYVAIDPIPRTGDACSDIGFYAAYHPPARAIATRARAVARVVGLEEERAARWAAVWAVGEATETWRSDSAELQTWVDGAEARALLEISA